MKKSDICILIVEDDITQGNALQSFIKKLGYKVQLARSGTEALKVYGRMNVDCVITDCMLPDKNGVDLANALMAEGFHGTLILTSGIFKDQTYKQDALRSTKAAEFLYKPLDLDALGEFLDKQLGAITEDNVDELFMTLRKANTSNREKIDAINAIENIHGFHLPLIYSLLSQSSLNGHLDLTYDDGKKAQLSYVDGKLTNVVFPDNKSYFGALLVENGFCSQEEVNFILEQKTTKKIGEELVDASFVSPHVIDIVQNEQALIRVSKSITAQMLQAKFTESPNAQNSSLSIDAYQVTWLLSDWITSKIDPVWLLQFYTPWMSYNVDEGPAFDGLDSFLQGTFLENMDQEKLKRLGSMTLQEVLESQSESQESLIQAMHFLFLQKFYVLGSSTRTVGNFVTHEARLRKIEKNMGLQNDFEILGVTKVARPSEIQKAYQDLAKVFHPDKLPPGTPDHLRELSDKVFSRITEAHRNLATPEKRQAYLRKLELGEAEDVLAAESQFETGLNLLRVGRLRDARKAFEVCVKMKGYRSDAYIYLSWALALEKRGVDSKRRKKLTQLLRSYMSKVPHEDRHSPPYFFAKGLLYELEFKPDKARACFKSCLALDANFIDAKRELLMLKKKYGNTRSTAMGEFSQIITRFLKNKAS